MGGFSVHILKDRVTEAATVSKNQWEKGVSLYFHLYICIHTHYIYCIDVCVCTCIGLCTHTYVYTWQGYVCTQWQGFVCAQSRPTHWDPMDCGLLGFSVHRILQARILEWVGSSRGSSPPGIEPTSLTFPAFTVGFFTTEPPRAAPWVHTLP